MTELSHGAVLACVAFAAAMLHGSLPGWTARGRRALLLAAACVLLPLPFVLLDPTDTLWTGKEGVLEALTEGLLLFLFGCAALARRPWIAGAALLLLAEELDYGQVLFQSIPTPDLIAQLGSRGSTFNFHNIPHLDAVWRLGPAAALIVLSRLRSPPLRLPRLHRWTAPAIGVLLVLSPVTVLLAGPERWNESFELALTALAGAAWLTGPDAPTPRSARARDSSESAEGAQADPGSTELPGGLP